MLLPEEHRLIRVIDDPKVNPNLEHATECVFSGDGSRAACVFTGEGSPYVRQLGIPSGDGLGPVRRLARVPDRVIAASGHTDRRIVMSLVSEGTTNVLVWNDANTVAHEIAREGTPELRVVDKDTTSLCRSRTMGAYSNGGSTTARWWPTAEPRACSSVTLSDGDVRLAANDPARGIVVQRLPPTENPAPPVLRDSGSVIMARFITASTMIGVVRNSDHDRVVLWRDGDPQVLQGSSTSRVTTLAAIGSASHLAAVGREDGTVDIWMNGSRNATALKGRSSPPRYIAVGASWLATSADDGTVSIWGFDGVIRAPEYPPCGQGPRDRVLARHRSTGARDRQPER